jgi:hypothetical protein
MITQFKLFESPDISYYDDSYKNMDAISFLYYENKFYFKKNTGTDYYTHTSIINEYIMNYQEYYKGFNNKQIYNQCKYLGRLWTNKKIISFWDYPENKEILYNIIKNIEENANIKIINNDYKIEVIDFNEHLKKLIFINLPTNILIDLKLKSYEDINFNYVNFDSKNLYFYNILITNIMDILDNFLYVKIIPIENYISSSNLSEKEKEKHLMNQKEKEKEKLSGWGKGFGSDKTAWDSKMNIKKRQELYQESLLYEACDNVKLSNGKELNYQDTDAVPFLFINDIFIIGENRSSHSDMLNVIIFLKNNEDYDIINLNNIKKYDFNFNINVTEEYNKYLKNIKNSGRIWLNNKVISFWDNISKYQLIKIIDILNIELNININDNYIIEYYFDNMIIQKTIFNFLNDININILSYNISKKDLEEQKKAHIISPINKKNINFIKGFGSDKTAWDSEMNIKKRQQLYQESKKYIK